MKVEQVSNGYILEFTADREIHPTLDGVFERLLAHFEGRAKMFSGDSYGSVHVYRCACRQSDGAAACALCAPVFIRATQGSEATQ